MIKTLYAVIFLYYKVDLYHISQNYFFLLILKLEYRKILKIDKNILWVIHFLTNIIFAL